MLGSFTTRQFEVINIVISNVDNPDKRDVFCICGFGLSGAMSTKVKGPLYPTSHQNSNTITLAPTLNQNSKLALQGLLHKIKKHTLNHFVSK